MSIKVRDAYALLLGLDDKPPNRSHGARKSIVSGEVVNISVYNTVYKTVYRTLVKPAPHSDQLSDDRVTVKTKRASNAANFRLIA
jgi:hypothetical protein